MRLDLFLKNAGLIPRRAVAKRACDGGLVKVNERSAKAGARVDVGDHIHVRTGERIVGYEILQLPERPVPKAERDGYARRLGVERRTRPAPDLLDE